MIMWYRGIDLVMMIRESVLSARICLQCLSCFKKTMIFVSKWFNVWRVIVMMTCHSENPD